MLELAGRGLRDQLERLAVRRNVDAHVSAVDKLAEQELLRERALDVLLDYASHRPRAHLLIVAALRNPRPRRGLELDRDVVLVELRLELEDQLVDDARNRFLVERPELDDRIEPVAEL